MKEKYVVFDIETTGLKPWFGDRVTCVCAKTSDGSNFSMCQEDEEDLLESFFEWLYDLKNYKLISKNGVMFDIPFLLTRISLKPNLQGIPKMFIANMEHEDLHFIVKKWISLDDYATILGVENKNGSGINAIQLFKDKQFEVLQRYCEKDVDVTEAVYLKRLELLKQKSEVSENGN